MKGRIKKLMDDRGFIIPDGAPDDHDIIFYLDRIQDKSFLKNGAIVEFDERHGKSGRPFAFNVRPAASQQAATTSQATANTGVSNATGGTHGQSKQTGVKGMYYGPRDTLSTVNPNTIDNYALKLNKMARWDNDKFKFYKTDRGNVLFEVKGDFKNIDFAAIDARFDALSAALEKRGWQFKHIDFAPDWRLILGIGNETVYETGITLHHIYGFPFIPGQAVKGATRSWIISELFGNKENGELDLKHAEERALQNPVFCHVFGSPKMASKDRKSAIGEHQGSIVFWDALPVTAPKIEVDVMNPHYSDYYKGNSWPVDYLKTKTIHFLTVGHDSRYRLSMGVKPGLNKKLAELGDSVFAGNDELSEESTLLDVAATWCNLALSEHGIGAKTAVGYGYAAQSNDISQ